MSIIIKTVVVIQTHGQLPFTKCTIPSPSNENNEMEMMRWPMTLTPYSILSPVLLYLFNVV